ncbi:MAG: hypothetical protein Q8P33_02375 [bacterium]|nr:hypothetical protein [bacterium]
MSQPLPALEPPEPLSRHEQSLVLVKAQPPEPHWAFYLVALFTSLGGFILGWVYLIKNGSANKLFGLRAILLGFVIPLVVVLVIVAGQIQQKGQQAPLPSQPGTLLPE